MARDKKRYVVQVDCYVYAENDYMARKRAHKMAKSLDNNGQNPKIIEIGEQPFASFGYRKLDDISEPIEKEKDEPLPF
jgi:hypothetical protein